MMPSTCSIADFEGRTPPRSEVDLTSEPVFSTNQTEILDKAAMESYFPVTPMSEAYFPMGNGNLLQSQRTNSPPLDQNCFNQLQYSGLTQSEPESLLSLEQSLATGPQSVFQHQRLNANTSARTHLPVVGSYGLEHNLASLVPPAPNQAAFQTPVSTLSPTETYPSRPKRSRAETDSILRTSSIPISRSASGSALDEPRQCKGGFSHNHVRSTENCLPFSNVSGALLSPTSPDTTFGAPFQSFESSAKTVKPVESSTAASRGYCPDCACQRVRMEGGSTGKYVTLRVPVEELLH